MVSHFQRAEVPSRTAFTMEWQVNSKVHVCWVLSLSTFRGMSLSRCRGVGPCHCQYGLAKHFQCAEVVDHATVRMICQVAFKVRSCVAMSLSDESDTFNVQLSLVVSLSAWFGGSLSKCSCAGPPCHEHTVAGHFHSAEVPAPASFKLEWPVLEWQITFKVRR